MKKMTALLFLFCAFHVTKAQSYEIDGTGRDTINFIDAEGKRQGHWIIKGYSKKGCYQEQQVAEKGAYKDNKRIGTWTEYHCNGNLKSTVEYQNGRPSGTVTLYYKDGTVWEEGTWKNNRWVGKYTMINDKGDKTEILFDEKGEEISKKVTVAAAK